MNYQYSKTHCNFCQSPLGTSPFDIGELRCFKCFGCPQTYVNTRYFKTIDMLQLNIKNYSFEFWFYDGGMTAIETNLTGKEKRYRLPQHLQVTLENYLDIVDRAKKLQTFG